MPSSIRIVVGELALHGELDDSELSRALLDSMPIEGNLCTFGDQYYVETEVDHDPGDDGAATEEVEVGDIAYWHPALALAFFFGPTPESAPGSDRPVPSSEVVKLGYFQDAVRLAEVRDAGTIRVERA